MEMRVLNRARHTSRAWGVPVFEELQGSVSSDRQGMFYESEAASSVTQPLRTELREAANMVGRAKQDVSRYKRPETGN